MPITQPQLDQIKKLAKAKGYSDGQIASSVAAMMKQYQGNQLNQQTGSQINTAGVSVSPAQNAAQTNQSMNTQPEAGFVSSFFKSMYTAVTDPLRKSAGFGTDIVLRNEALGGGEEMRKQNPFLNEDEVSQLDTVGGAAKQQVKNIAGIGSVVTPGTIGVGKTALGIAGRAAGAGAIAGGLQGFGASEEGEELGDTITGAGVGAATAGVLSGAGQAIKAVRESRVQSDIGRKLSQAGTDFKKSAYVKAAGRKPILREGGDKLLDKMVRAGIKPGSPDELIYQADDILIDNAGVIFEKADEFRQKGVVIDKEKVLAPLQSKLQNAPAKSKSVIQKVIDFVKSDLDRFDDFTPAEAYAMKGDYGPFGNWTSTMDADAITEANVWEEVYTNLNNLMDESFKKGGYEDFRAVNEVVSTAINTKKFASRAGNVAPNLNTLGLMDAIAGATGFATGGVPTAVAAMAGKKVLNSPQFASGVGNTLEKIGTNLANKTPVQQTAGNTIIGEILSKLAQRGAVSTSTSTGSRDLVESPDKNLQPYGNQNTLEDKNYQDTPIGENNAQIIPQEQDNAAKPFGGRSKVELIQLAIARGATRKDLEEISGMYDMAFGDQENEADKLENLLNKRKTLSEAGFSTESIDSQIEQLGFKRMDGANSTMTDAQKKFGPALSRAFTQMEKISAIGTKDSIFQGGSTSIGKAVGSAKAQARKATDSGFASRIEQYESQLNLIVGSLSQMMGSGTPQEGEAERLLGSIPDENTSEANAEAWFDNVRVVLGVK